MSIQNEFEYRCAKPSDINEHLEALRDLAQECNHITEMGVRGIVSTYAFLEGLKGHNGTLISIDMCLPSYFGGDLDQVERLAKVEGVNFKFVLGNTLFIDIEETDLLFIDTLHTGEQLRKELARHAGKVRKYLAFHDTISCESELVPAINEFIAEGGWKIKEHRTMNNGVLTLERC